MTGIAGLDLPTQRVRELLARYAVDYYDAMDRAFTKAGVERMPVDPSGHEPWEPPFPAALRPDWVMDVKIDVDDGEMRIDFDGPEIAGLMVTQLVIVDLRSWDRAAPPRTVVFVVEPLVVFGADGHGINGELILTLEEARAHTAGMIAAGKLMASLLEPPQEVR